MSKPALPVGRLVVPTDPGIQKSWIILHSFIQSDRYIHLYDRDLPQSFQVACSIDSTDFCCCMEANLSSGMRLLLKKFIKNVTRCRGIAEQQKVKNQGRDDHIKQVYNLLDIVHVLWEKVPVGGCILDCLYDHPYLVSLLFAILLSLHLVTYNLKLAISHFILNHIY